MLSTHPTPEPVPQIQKVITNYLRIESNYALLVNGKRGIGKTFFIKNKVLPQITGISVQHDHSKKYKPIYISLYGIKSIDDIYGLLSLEFLPFLKRKDVQVTLAVGKLLTRGLLNFKQLGDGNDYLKDISSTAKKAIDTKDFVIIFDDLDRISPDLKISEIVGFINSLVEHDNNKILIIADELAIADNKSYLEVREKTIGTVIEYNFSFEETFEEIISGKYKAGFASYYHHLKALKPEILNIFGWARSTNLRTLLYFLQHFDVLFHELHDTLQLEKEIPPELSLRKLKILCRFSLALCIEFKTGKIAYTSPNGIDDVNSINQSFYDAWLRENFADTMKSINNPASAKKTAEPRDYKYQFVDTYFPEKNFQFYRSIFDFITGGNTLDLALLLRELKENIDDKLFNPSPQESVYGLLSKQDVYNLSNHKLRQFSGRLYRYAVRGQYPLDRYPNILFYLTRFPDILPYRVAELTAELIAGIKRYQKNFSYEQNLEQKLSVSEDNPDAAYYQVLSETMIDVNNSLRVAASDARKNELWNRFITDKEDFYSYVINEYMQRALFTAWNKAAFLKHIDKMKPTEIIMFTKFLRDRYGYLQDADWVEDDFLSSLFNHIQFTPEHDRVTLRDGVLEDLSKVLTSVLTRYKKTVNR